MVRDPGKLQSTVFDDRWFHPVVLAVAVSLSTMSIVGGDASVIAAVVGGLATAVTMHLLRWLVGRYYRQRTH
jgi:hypothetical protein